MDAPQAHPEGVYHRDRLPVVHPYRVQSCNRQYPGLRPSLTLRTVALGYPWYAPLGRGV